MKIRIAVAVEKCGRFVAYGRHGNTYEHGKGGE